MVFRYLSKDVLAGFDKYKYSAIDTSPISNYITHPFWNWLVQFFPVWVAPNTITLAGFLLLPLQFLVLSYYDPEFLASNDGNPEYPPIPRWVWLFSSLCIFFAHTLDGIDGKQARRTKTSGPLGEMFDHGLDSWITVFMPVGIFSIFGIGAHSINYTHCLYVLASVQVSFIFSHWEKYNTGILYLPWAYDISQLGMALLFLATYISGNDMWKFTVPYIGWNIGTFMEYTVMYAMSLGFAIPVSLWNVYQAHVAKTSKGRGLYEGCRPIFPVVVLYGLFFIWVNYSPTAIMDRQPRLMLLACGTTFANIACRLIVAQMSSSRCHGFNALLLPLAMIVATVVLFPTMAVWENAMCIGYTILALAAHLHYGICVVDQLADHLHIYIFSTKRPPTHD